MRSLFSLLLLLAAPAVAQTGAQPGTVPDAPQPQAAQKQLKVRDVSAPREKQVVVINGRPYRRPTQHQLFIDYVNDSYGLPAFTRSMVRSLYGQARGLPIGWNYRQRLGSALATTAINGNVRYGMEETFHEDLRYIPCHGCNAKHKIENALLAEITARHSTDGHRFFTLTPTIADFSGPIVAHSLWYPSGFNPFGGVVASRTVFAHTHRKPSLPRVRLGASSPRPKGTRILISRKYRFLACSIAVHRSYTGVAVRSHPEVIPVKKLLSLSVLALSLAPLSAFAQQQSFKGTIADAMCAKNPAKASGADHAACAEKCIKGGEAPVIIVGSKVYKIANPDKVVAFAGKQVTLDGSLAEDTITVSSVKE